MTWRTFNWQMLIKWWYSWCEAKFKLLIQIWSDIILWSETSIQHALSISLCSQRKADIACVMCICRRLCHIQEYAKIKWFILCFCADKTSIETVQRIIWLLCSSFWLNDSCFLTSLFSLRSYFLYFKMTNSFQLRVEVYEKNILV